MTSSFLFTVCALGTVWVAVWCENSEEQQDSLAVIVQNLYRLHERVQEQETETIAHLDEKFEGLMSLLKGSIVEDLHHISSVVDAMDRRQKLTEFCPPGTCGDHGICDLSDRPQGYECTCDNTHHGDHCEFEFGPCETEFRRIEAGPMMPGMELPRCDDEGYYLGMQYKGSMAICVSRTGERIHGYGVHRWETGDDMDCQCARDESASGTSETQKRKFFCNSNGNYAQVACNNEVCWCQNSKGERYGGQVPVGELDAELHC